MTVSQHLLDILCCPITHVALKPLGSAALVHLNEAIARGEIQQADGSPVTTPLQDGLVTLGGEWIYRIDDDIPVMLADQAISVPASLRSTIGS